MMFFEILRQMLRTLWAHKLRSFLTMFGIAWGVGSLLLLVGLGEGFRSGNRRELNSLGEDIMFVFPGRAPAIAGNMASGRTYNLTDDDYKNILDEAPHVLAAAPVLSRMDMTERRTPQDGHAVALVHSEDETTGTLQITATRPPGAGGVSGQGAVVSLTFQAKASGQTPLTITRGGALDPGQQRITVNGAQASVTVQ